MKAKLKNAALFAGGHQKSNITNINPSTYGVTDFSFYNFLSGSNGDLRALEAIRYYKNCMPMYRAIEMRAEAFSSIPIRVQNVKTKEFLPDHPSLELVGEGGKPNPAFSVSEFLKQYASFRDITGETFLIAQGAPGNGRSEPTSVSTGKPQDVTIGTSQTRVSGIYEVPGSYWWNTDTFSDRYKIDPNPNLLGRSFRYYNIDQTREIWQSGDFNPTASSASFRGFSKAGPISLEIQQFIEGNVNNKSVLSRGARPSVAWVSQLDEPLTDDQYERWKEQVTSYEGALNAGKQVLVDAVEPKIVSTTNKDMEFSELKKSVRQDIFVQYQIPLALVTPEQMTLDNLKTSVTQFFDLSVLPYADNLLEELTLFLMPRYKNSEDLRFTYNPVDILPLKERAIEQASRLVDLAILSDNELRQLIGEEVREGGETIYKPISMVPSDQVGNMATVEEAQKARALESFRKHCRTVKNSDGERAYTDNEIEVLAAEKGLILNSEK